MKPRHILKNLPVCGVMMDPLTIEMWIAEMDRTGKDFYRSGDTLVVRGIVRGTYDVFRQTQCIQVVKQENTWSGIL